MQPTADVRRRDDGSIDFDFYRLKAAKRRRAAKRLALSQAVRLTRRAVRAGLLVLTQPVPALRQTDPQRA